MIGALSVLLVEEFVGPFDEPQALVHGSLLFGILLQTALRVWCYNLFEWEMQRMFTKATGNSVAQSSQPKVIDLEQHCEIAREIYQTIHLSSLNKFTFSVINVWWADLSRIIHVLERLPEEAFKEYIAVIQGLNKARNELRDACFLFEVEEIQPVHRLIMRNRAILRANEMLERVIQSWTHR